MYVLWKNKYLKYSCSYPSKIAVFREICPRQIIISPVLSGVIITTIYFLKEILIEHETAENIFDRNIDYTTVLFHPSTALIDKISED